MSTAPSNIDALAAAVMYEGYILYPYRPSLKNVQRWTFGGVYPRAWSGSHEDDACQLQMECLLEIEKNATLDIRVRFLHLIERSVGELIPPITGWPGSDEPAYRSVEQLQVGNESFHNWQEAAEREICLSGVPLAELVAAPRRQAFQFPERLWHEGVCDEEGRYVGVLARSTDDSGRDRHPSNAARHWRIHIDHDDTQRHAVS